MRLISVVLLSAGWLVSTPPAQTDGWRGIAPLRSTRADVERLIGRPNFGGDRYDFEHERVAIMYSREPCSGGMQGAYNVPRDTVISIDIAPKRRLTLSDLKLDLGKFKKTSDPVIEVHTSYNNGEEGVSIGTSGRGRGEQRTVTYIYYGPRAGDAYLRCPDPAHQAGAGDSPEAGPADDRSGPLGECPIISIERTPDSTPPDGEYTLSALIVGGDPRFNVTLKWSVSAGVIVGGQGTSTVKIDTSGADCDPVIVTLEVGGGIPKGCSRVKTYTIKHSNP